MDLNMSRVYQLADFEIDYVAPSKVKKVVGPESSRKITFSSMRGRTLVRRITDKNYEVFAGSNGRGQGID